MQLHKFVSGQERFNRDHVVLPLAFGASSPDECNGIMILSSSSRMKIAVVSTNGACRQAASWSWFNEPIFSLLVAIYDMR